MSRFFGSASPRRELQSRVCKKSLAPHAAADDLDVALPKLSFECDGAPAASSSAVPPVKRAATATASFEAPVRSASRVELCA